MKELTLEELKEIELNILKVFDAFCRENNICYYLAYGTLLGAVRYKKFIPWDDDVDVLVPREDYERLMTLYKDSEQYQLFAFEKDGKFPYPYAKLCDMTTRKTIPIYTNKNAVPGIEIDIFPLDAWDSDEKKSQKEVDKICNYMRWLEAAQLKRSPVKQPVKRICWSIFIAFAKIIGEKYFVKKIIQISKSVPMEDAKFVGAKTWCVYRSKGIIPAEVFADTVEIEFEGQKFPAPIGYDQYLTCLYGDYMPEPPEEKQVSRHIFKAYRR